MVAHVRDVSFDAALALDRARNIRAITPTPEPVIARDKSGELFKWLRCHEDFFAAPPLSISLIPHHVTSIEWEGLGPA